MSQDSGNKLGPLEKANKTLLGAEYEQRNGIFVLDHWLSKSKASDESQAKHSRILARSGQYRTSSLNSNSSGENTKTTTTRLLLNRTSELTLNLLFRWILLEESTENAIDNDERQVELDSRGQLVTRRRKRRDRSELLISDITKLPDKRFPTLIKYLFRRSLTWSNIFEFLLLVFLLVCCTLQCLDILDEYYSTHVTVLNRVNNDFQTDLPAITLCDSNRMSRKTLQTKYPHLNDTHYLAIALDSFESVDNFTIPSNGKNFLGSSYTNLSGFEAYKVLLDPNDIDWYKVGQYFINDSVDNFVKFLPMQDPIDTITCANIWGKHLPCANLKRLQTIQLGLSCHTLFHDSVFWDRREPAVKELETAVINNPSTVDYGTFGVDDGRSMKLMRESSEENLPVSLLIAEDEMPENEPSQEEMEGSKRRIYMGQMEMLRLRLDFRPKDHMNKHSTVGATIAIHSNSAMGDVMNYLSFNIKPGYWYNYYIKRFDFHRLPSPYDTDCYDYEQNRYVWQDRQRWIDANKLYIWTIISSQVKRNDQLNKEYARILRLRALGTVSRSTRLESRSQSRCNLLAAGCQLLTLL